MTVAVCEETGALGAAIVAGLGAGVFKSLDAGVKSMTSPKKTYIPNPEMKPHYDRRYALFGKLTASMGDFWEQQQNLKD